MARSRLRAVGLDVPESQVRRPSHRLYELVSDAHVDGYSRYKALIASLVGFARAAERAGRLDIS